MKKVLLLGALSGFFFFLAPILVLSIDYALFHKGSFNLNIVGLFSAIFLSIGAYIGLNMLIKILPHSNIRHSLRIVLLMVPSVMTFWAIHMAKENINKTSNILVMVMFCHLVGAILYVNAEIAYKEVRRNA